MAQIGTIKLQTQNNGTVSVPVFNTGDSGSDVYEFVRVQTASGTGFIPVVDPASASYPYLRVQSQNQGVVAVHNEATLVDPDLYEQWDISQQSESDGSTIDPLVGQENGRDLSAVNTPTMNTGAFNNNDAAVLQGDTEADRWQSASISFGPPYTIYSVVRLDDTTEARTIMRSSSASIVFDWYLGNWRIGNSSDAIQGSNDETQNLIVAQIDSNGDAILREGGTETASGNIGTESVSDLGVGHRYGDTTSSTSPWDGLHMEHRIYTTAHSTSEIQSIESELTNKWL